MQRQSQPLFRENKDPALARSIESSADRSPDQRVRLQGKMWAGLLDCAEWDDHDRVSIERVYLLPCQLLQHHDSSAPFLKSPQPLGLQPAYLRRSTVVRRPPLLVQRTERYRPRTVAIAMPPSENGAVQALGKILL